MTNPKSRLFAAVAGALSLGAAAWAVEPAQTDAKIQQLEAKVAALEAKQAQNSKDLATTVDAVLRDAEKRSQLLANGGEMGAGYDGGFYIRAGDNWVLRPSILFQFWNVTDFRQDVVKSSGSTDDELDNGFEIHRLQLAFEGTAFTKDLTYEFRWDTNSDGGSFTLLDAYARYMFADDWGFRLGQYKDPVAHEILSGDQYILAAERSLASAIFFGTGATNRVQGVSLVYGGYNKNNPINAEVAFTDGFASANTDFTKNGELQADWGASARVEWKAMGDWRDYRDFTAKGNKEDLLVFGIGADWSQAGDGNAAVAALDGQWETTGGLGVFGAAYLRYLDGGALGASDSTTDFAVLGQVGYMLTPSWELFGRYNITWFDDDVLAGANQDTFQEVTVGVNYYMGANGAAGHRAKFTVDFTWLPDGVPASVNSLGFGAQDNNPGNNEFMLRAQFQLLI